MGSSARALTGHVLCPRVERSSAYPCSVIVGVTTTGCLTLSRTMPYATPPSDGHRPPWKMYCLLINVEQYRERFGNGGAVGGQ
jgi:hypothetical protein